MPTPIAEPAIADPPPPVVPFDDIEDGLDGATISISTHRQREAQAAAEAEAAAGPRVQARLCPAGHPSPPHASFCRECGAEITDPRVHTIPRPVLGRFVFDDGTTIEVDSAMLMGRNPPEDGKVGDEPARPVRLVDPDALLSRVHLAVQIEGWQVQIIDRESVNHTFVAVPGQQIELEQIQPGIPISISVGTRVVLAETVSFTFEAAG